MGTDVSRVRFDALTDHSGVFMQQGRLLLDADWNELVDILERRLRVGSVDLGSTGPVAGIAGVAVVPRTTPDGFKLETDPQLGLVIDPGRMYVDGLLAENHGFKDGAYDVLLQEATRSLATPYVQQPWWPTPTPLPAGGTHVAYLDVWQREVTSLEEPGLVDPAVGVDTTTRTQTVWQVRFHAPDTPGLTCATKDAAITGWTDLIAPSAGRLTTGTVAVSATDDPCSLPPSGDYRGLENQTYRVEIHQPGPAGTATFTWSRDNGSVAMAVTEVISATRLRPSSLGPDTVLGLSPNDWVEIIDDHRELNQQSGELRMIQVHTEDGTIEFAPALPADLVPADAADLATRHLRIRRWDQKGVVQNAAGGTVVDLNAAGATGDIRVPGAATDIVLENGITVRLEAPGGRFRVGDHWVFAARTATTSVEALLKAPPRGLHHHYARLGVLTGPAPTSDCRTLWPPEGEEGGCGDCTVCVTPQSHASGVLTIQAAVDQVRPTGGTVCLASGDYQLVDAPVRMEGCRAVRLRGQGPRSRILAAQGALDIVKSAYVTVEDLAIVASSRAPAVQVTTTAEVTLRELTILLTDPADFEVPAPAIGLAGVNVALHVRDNEVVAPVCLGGADGDLSVLTAGLDVTGNAFVGLQSGVLLDAANAHLLGNTVADNVVLRCPTVGIRMLGAVAPSGSVTVRDNVLNVQGSGIDVAGAGFTVRDNQVTAADDPSDAATGISVSTSALGDYRSETTLSGNSVRGLLGNGMSINAGVTLLRVEGSTVEACGGGIVMADAAAADEIQVTGNVLKNIGPGRQGATRAAGIWVVDGQHALVSDNQVSGIGTAMAAQGSITAIGVVGCQECRVRGNAVDTVGPLQNAALVMTGISVIGVGTGAHIEGNDVRRLAVGIATDGQGNQPQTRWTGIDVNDVNDGSKELDLLKGGNADNRVLLGRDNAVALRGTDFRVIVRGNAATGGGITPAIDLDMEGGEVIVTDNYADQNNPSELPGMRITANRGTVSSNRVRSGRPSIQLTVPGAAVLGNLTSNGITVSGAPLGAPWQPMNIDGV